MWRNPVSLIRYHLGCPIWAKKEWVGELFTQDAKSGDFLKQYSSVFNTVEGNTTFYGVPAPATLQRWADDTPESFRFCFKFPRTVTHFKSLQDAGEETLLFLNALDPLGPRVGPIFLQFPPSFAPSELPTLDAYLESLPSTYAYAVEVRHTAFNKEAAEPLHKVLAKHGVERVLFDARGLHSAVVENDPATREAQHRKPAGRSPLLSIGPNPFVRFIGHPTVDENRPLLAEWAELVAHWIEEGRHPYFFVHAPDDFFAPRLARVFHTELSRHLDVGELPEWPANSSISQGQLNLF